MRRPSSSFALVAAASVACSLQSCKPDVRDAQAELANDVRVVCAPPPENPALPGGSELSDTDVRASFAKVAAARDDASSDSSRLESSLRSSHPTVAHALRFSALDLSSPPKVVADPSSRTAPPRTVAIAALVSAMTTRLDGELAWGPGGPSIRTCTDLALLVRDLLRVGDLGVVEATTGAVLALATKCEDGLDGTPPEVRSAFGEALQTLADDAITIANLRASEQSEWQLLRFGGLLTDAMLPCDAAKALARKTAPPKTNAELRELHDAFTLDHSVDNREGGGIPVWAKPARLIEDMKTRLAKVAAHALREPRRRRSDLPGSSGRDPKSNVLNPKYRTGEYVRVRADGACYFRTIANAPSNSPVDPWRTIIVDCPSELDDPAFDRCLDGTLSRGGSTGCECTPAGGGSFPSACPH